MVAQYRNAISTLPNLFNRLNLFQQNQSITCDLCQTGRIDDKKKGKWKFILLHLNCRTFIRTMVLFFARQNRKKANVPECSVDK